MRQQYHFRQSEQGLLAWDVLRLIEITKKLPIIDVPISDISELDEEFWYELGGAKPTCRSVLEHAALINYVDLSYPIILCHQGRIMDGMHRVCKALLMGQNSIRAVQLPEYVEPDYIVVDPEDLPYDDETT
ncbi:hypothetical protein [Vibrio coralliilyticus]|uniref:hypothetical protein n=1 Tax=Vibrio coralliilyticus TaxID=190893 RepID=UPI00148CEC57|nr:hypothetical protein [Vibrio coralliilyticus]NOI29248.1 hypothetical protein [Vibrio coralliilyticus]NOI48488.1 hypothetical protein [Vibrio coralliilyticus]